MNHFNDAYETMGMIETKKLITLKQIKEFYGIDEEAVDIFVGDGDISVPMQYCATDYFLSAEIEFLHKSFNVNDSDV